MNDRYLRSIYWRLAGVIMLVVALALAANAYLSHRTFERALTPVMGRYAATVGDSIRTLVVKAVDNGIDFQGLYGVDAKFAEVDDETPNLSYFSITDPAGHVLYQRPQTSPAIEAFLQSPEGRSDSASAASAREPRLVGGTHYLVSLPIARQGQTLGGLHIGIDVGFVDHIVLEMLYDVLVVLVVALFFTLELLHFIAGARIEASLKAIGEAFERGAAGRFDTAPPRDRSSAFSSLLALMHATLERVNAAYVALERDVEAARRGPAHERPPGLAAAQSGLADLAQRYEFGRRSADAAPTQDLLPRVRAPLFIFILAEELTRSFLPGYVRELLVDIPGLTPQFVLGLPIALFMLIVAIAQPYFGVLSERIGQRKLMLTGAAVAAAGFGASAVAASVLDLMLWRSLCAVGYAMVFVAGQAYVLEHAGTASRAKSFSLFVGAIMVATVCGPSIGGILADNIGARSTFGVAALLALGSLLAIRRLPEGHGKAGEEGSARVPTLGEIGTLLANRRFMTVTGLAAIPAKVLLTGVCFYLVPLYVLSIGATPAMAGRVLMSYAVVMVVFSPLAAAWATTRERMEWLVGGGLLVSGLGGVALLAGDHVGWVFLAVVLVGVGQAMSISAQSALVGEHCPNEIAQVGAGGVYGVYRLLERLGNAVGPLLAAGLVVALGYRNSFAAIGGFVVTCGVLFVLATRRTRAVQVATA